MCYIFNIIERGVLVAKTVLITGASGGIGTATACLFAEKGYNVVINYNNSERQARLLQKSLTEHGAKSICIGANVSYPSEVNSMIKQAEYAFGNIDVLVNNAGISQIKQIQDITDNDWHEMIATNLTGVFNCARAVVPSMIRNKSGAIINVSSMWGLTGASMETHYSAAKAGVIGFTKALAKELGPSGIRVNCVAPGVIETNMNRNITLEAVEQLSDETPLGRLGSPIEVAEAIYFLASEQASFITGQVISPNGGLVI